MPLSILLLSLKEERGMTIGHSLIDIERFCTFSRKLFFFPFSLGKLLRM